MRRIPHRPYDAFSPTTGTTNKALGLALALLMVLVPMATVVPTAGAQDVGPLETTQASADTDVTPVQALDSHPIYDAIDSLALGRAALAQQLITDGDGNRATDFLDLWVQQATLTGHDDAPIEVLAWWNGEPSQLDADAFAVATNAHAVQVLPEIDALFATVPSDQAHDALSLDGLELLVWEPRVHATVRDPASGDVDDMDHINVVDAKGPHQAGFTGEGTTIAVLDTGIDCSHPSFQYRTDDTTINGCGEKVVDFQVYTGESGDPAGFDNHGHGTHVASTAAGYEPGHYTGTAPDALLIGLKVLDGSGSGSLAGFQQAVNYIKSHNDTIDVATMSAGLGVPPLGLTPLNGGEIDVLAWDRVAAQVTEQGNVPFTVSAGNVVTEVGFTDVYESPPVGVNGVNQVASPGFDPAVITVGSTTRFGIHAFHSAVGPGPTGATEDLGGHEEALVKPDVLAMGHAVWGAQTNTDEYVQMTGTSMATPGAAGVAALLLEKNPGLTPAQVKQALQDGARVGHLIAGFDETAKPRPDFAYGHGVTQASVSLSIVEAPVIDFIDVEASLIRDDSAVITWTTNNRVDSVVEYGPAGSSLDQSVSDATKGTSHSLELTGLSPDTSYDFRVRCTDGSGCPATTGTLTFTTFPVGQVSSQHVSLYAHDVFVFESDGTTTFGDPPFAMDTLTPAGEPDNQDGTIYTIPGPVGPNSWEVDLEPALQRSLKLDASKDALATFHVQPIVVGSCSAGCLGVLPLTVTATLYSDDQPLGTGSQEKLLEDLDTASQQVTTFEIPLDLTADQALDTQDLRLVYEWSTTADVALNELMWIHGGENFPLRVDVPLENPVNVDAIDVTTLSSGNQLITASVESPFGAYDLDPSSGQIEVRDTNGDLVPATLVPQADPFTWVWDNTNDGITNGTYTVEVTAADVQGATAARATTFVLSTDAPENLAPSLSDLLADPASVKNDGVATTTLSAAASDSDGSIASVTANLTPIGGGADTAMTEIDPGVYAVETTVAPSTALGDVSLAVTATDDDGATATGAITLTVLDGIAPSAPGSLTVTETDQADLLLAWTAATDNVGVDHYEVLRKADGESAFTELDTVPAGTTEYLDVTAQPAILYTYRVQAVDAEGNVGPAAEETGSIAAVPTVAIEAPAPGEVVSESFAVSGQATVPQPPLSTASTPKVVATDPAGDAETTSGSADDGHLDIVEVVGADQGGEVAITLRMADLGGLSQAGSVFYGLRYDVDGQGYGTSAHVVWAGGQPQQDDGIYLTHPGRIVLPSDLEVNLADDTITLTLDKHNASLGIGDVMEDLQVWSSPTLDGGPTTGGGVSVPTADEVVGTPEEPIDYRVQSLAEARLADDPAGEFPLDSTDIRGLDAWDAGDDLTFRLKMDSLTFIDTVNGDVFYTVLFKDAATGTPYYTAARIIWAGGQPVVVDDDPLLLPSVAASFVGSDVDLDRSAASLEFTLSKQNVELTGGVTSVSATTFLVTGGLLLPTDQVPNGATAGDPFPASTLAYPFATDPGQLLFQDAADDTASQPTSPVRDTMLDLRNGTVHEDRDELVVRLSMDRLGFLDDGNGEALYQAILETADGRTLSAEAQVFWASGTPVATRTVDVAGPGDDAKATAQVNRGGDTVTLRIPKLGNGLLPGDEVTSITGRTYSDSVTLIQLDDATGGPRTLVQDVPPFVLVETDLDASGWTPATVTGFAGGVFTWEQPMDAQAIASGAHTVDARTTDGLDQTSAIESRSFTANHGPTIDLVIAPNPTGVGEATLLDASGTTDAEGTVETLTIDPGDGTGPQDVTATGVLEHAYEASGLYTLTVAATDDLGVTTSSTTQVAVLSVHNEDQGTWHATIQDAIDQASPGDTILATSGLYEERLDLHVQGLTLCPANATISGCGTEGSVTVDASGHPSPVVSITADNVTIGGLTVQWLGPPTTDLVGIELSADGAHLHNNTVRLQGGGCSVEDITGGCYEPAGTTAILAPSPVAGAVVVDNELRADEAADDGTIGGTDGLRGQLDQGLVRGNYVTGWASSAAAVWGDGLHVDQNTFRINGDGLLTCSGSYGETTNVSRNEFLLTLNAVAITRCGGNGTGVQAVDNQLGATNQNALWLKENVQGLRLNAECNDWGVYHGVLIPTRIRDDGTDNEVDHSPYTGVAGSGGLECLVAPDAAFDWTPSHVNRTVTVQFDDQSEEGSRPIVDWAWSFGDGTTSDEQEPTHQYQAVGTYEVRLTVTDVDGMISTRVQALEVVNEPPTLAPIDNVVRDHTADVLIQLQAEDDEGDPLTYSVDPLPAGASIDESTGFFSWDPAPSQHGEHWLNFTVEDGYDATTQAVMVRVVNEAPVIEPIGTKATREEITLTFDVVATDAEGDTITIEATGLPTNATFVSDGAAGTFAWTPSVGEAGSYNVTFTATSAGPLTDTVTVPINVGQYNAPPELLLDVGSSIEARPGEQVTINAEASDVDNATSELSWTVVNVPDVAGVTVTHATETTTVWSWEANPSQADELLVTFQVSDGINTVQLSTLVDVLQPPAATVYTPEDVAAGTFTDRLVVDTPVTLRGFARDADGSVVSATFYPEGLGGPSVQATSPAPRFYTAPYSYGQTGSFDVVLEVTDSDGLVSRDVRTITVVSNTAPVVDAGSDVSVEAKTPAGASVALSGTATDPDARGIDAGSFTWTLPNGQTLSGKDVTHTFPVGTHTVTLNVADVHGGIGEDTLTVVVDDYITATGDLSGASRQTEDGVYVIDKTQGYALGDVIGTLSVLDDQGAGVDGASFVGRVTYYGLEGNGNGLSTGTFSGSTDANGSATFAYDHELLGVLGQDGLLSAPGYHEIEVRVGALSRAGAPASGEVLEVTSLVLRYWVGPAPAGTV